MGNHFIVRYTPDDYDENGILWAKMGVCVVVSAGSAIALRAAFDAEIKFRQLLKNDTARYRQDSLAVNQEEPQAGVFREHMARLTAPADIAGHLFPHVHCLKGIESVFIHAVANRA